MEQERSAVLLGNSKVQYLFKSKEMVLWAQLHYHGGSWQPWQRGDAILWWFCIIEGAEVEEQDKTL